MPLLSVVAALLPPTTHVLKLSSPSFRPMQAPFPHRTPLTSRLSLLRWEQVVALLTAQEGELQGTLSPPLQLTICEACFVPKQFGPISLICRLGRRLTVPLGPNSLPCLLQLEVRHELIRMAQAEGLVAVPLPSLSVWARSLRLVPGISLLSIHEALKLSSMQWLFLRGMSGLLGSYRLQLRPWMTLNIRVLGPPLPSLLGPNAIANLTFDSALSLNMTPSLLFGRTHPLENGSFVLPKWHIANWAALSAFLLPLLTLPLAM